MQPTPLTSGYSNHNNTRVMEASPRPAVNEWTRVGTRTTGARSCLMMAIPPASPHALEQARAELALIAPHCRWTEGRWPDTEHPLGVAELQNNPRHISTLSNYLLRIYVQEKAKAA
ncbi:hypothetical protein SHIRM173S_06588 [Streptomyces hirsutus]